MALTPQDVVNKRFQHVKFREGYDQEEVDDFLDEVVLELRRLYQENDELRQKLSACEQRNQELSQGQGAAQTSTEAQPTVGSQPQTAGQPTASQQPAEDPQATQAMPAAVPERGADAQAPAADAQQSAPHIASQQPAGSGEQRQQSSPVSPLAAGGAGLGSGAAVDAFGGGGAGQQDAHGLIQLAQRLHDEHVAEGERTRDQLIAEARGEAESIVKDAEKKRDDTLSSLETQKSTLEREIDGLQNFERQYRTRLKSYLNDQLRELENSGSLAPETLGGGQHPGHSI